MNVQMKNAGAKPRRIAKAMVRVYPGTSVQRCIDVINAYRKHVASKGVDWEDTYSRLKKLIAIAVRDRHHHKHNGISNA